MYPLTADRPKGLPTPV